MDLFLSHKVNVFIYLSYTLSIYTCIEDHITYWFNEINYKFNINLENDRR